MANETVNPNEICIEPPFRPSYYPLADPKYFDVPRPIEKMQFVGPLPSNFKHAPVTTISEFDTDVPAYKYEEWTKSEAIRDIWTTTYGKSFIDHSPYRKMNAFEKPPIIIRDQKPDCYLYDKPQSLFPKVPIQKQDNELAIAARQLASKFKSPEMLRAAQINWGQFLKENPEKFKLENRTLIPLQSEYHYNGAKIVYMPNETVNARMRLRTHPSANHCYKLQPINQETLQTYRKVGKHKLSPQKTTGEISDCSMKIKLCRD